MIIIYILRGLLRLVLLLAGSLKVTGRDNVPERGPYILVVNHMSKADPPILFLALPPMRLRFFAGEKWERHRLFGPIMKVVGVIYINRGEVDRRALREAMEALRDGCIFGLAPEGTRSRSGQLLEAKDGAAYLASRTNVPIVPVGVTNTDVVGANVKRLKRTQMAVNIGKPFKLPELGHRAKARELEAYTHLIMVQIAHLLPERYHGYYADSPALAALQRGEDPWPYCLQVAGVTAEAEERAPAAGRAD